MRKEVGIALLLGSIIGVGLALFVTSTARPSLVTDNTLKKGDTNQTNTTLKQQSFSLTSPEQSLAVHGTTTIQGNTSSEAEYILLKIGSTQTLNKLNGQSFSADLTFSPGPTSVEIVAIKKDNSIERLKRTFIGTNNEYEETARRIFMGTITDIVEQTIQIRTQGSDVAQAAVTDSTLYKSYIKTPKDLKFSDIAIGDYIATIGTLSEKGILTTKELFVLAPQATDTDTSVDIGVITDVSKKQIIIQTKDDNKTYEISSHAIRLVNPDGTLARATSSSLKKDLRVIVTDSTFYVIAQP